MAKNELYAYYNPSLAAAIVVLVLYLASTTFATWQSIRYKTPLLFFLLVGSALEAVAFLARAYSISHEDDVWGFLIGSLLPVIAPSFIAASCYQIFGRIVWAVTPVERLNAKTLWVPARWITPIFCLFDLVSFLIQLLGVGVIASAFNPSDPQVVDGRVIVDEEKAQNGTRIVEVGVVMQVICFGLFALLAWRFTFVSRAFRPNIPDTWKRLSWAVNGAGTLIALRAVFRTFEYASPPDQSNYVVANEWCLYVLDCIPVLLTLLLLHVFHPGKHLPHEFVGFRLNKKAMLRQRRDEATVELGNNMYNDPLRMSVGVSHGSTAEAGMTATAAATTPPPPGYTEWQPASKGGADISAMELGKISR